MLKVFPSNDIGGKRLREPKPPPNQRSKSAQGTKKKEEEEATAEPPAKRACVAAPFDWLPDEIVRQILKELPRKLDGVHRLVCGRWRAILGEWWVRPLEMPGLSMFRVEQARRSPVGWAIRHGKVALLDWLLTHPKHGRFRSKISDGGAWFRLACRTGQRDVLYWMYHSPRAPKEILGPRTVLRSDVCAAAESGDLATLKYVAALCCRKFTQQLAYAAYESGSVDCIRWVLGAVPYAERAMFNAPAAMQAAARGGHKELIQDLCTQYDVSEPNAAVVAAAASRGHLELVKWLVDEKKAIVNNRVFHHALSRRHMPICEWFLDYVAAPKNDIQFTVSTSGLEAIEARDMEMLEWLDDKGILRVDAISSFNRAIQSDDKDAAMLQWLWERHQRNVHRDLARGIITGSMGPSPDVILRAIRRNSLDALRWISGLPHFDQLKVDPHYGRLSAELGDAASAGRIKILRLVHEFGIRRLPDARIIGTPPHQRVELHLSCDHLGGRCYDVAGLKDMPGQWEPLVPLLWTSPTLPTPQAGPTAKEDEEMEQVEIVIEDEVTPGVVLDPIEPEDQEEAARKEMLAYPSGYR